MRKVLVAASVGFVASVGFLGAGVAYADTVFESEPNDTAATANNLGIVHIGHLVSANWVPGGGGQVFNTDWFTFTLPDTGFLWDIETLPDFQGLGDGIADTRLFLYSDAGNTLIDSDDDGGLLDPDTGFGLSLLTGIAPGTYWLENRGFTDDDGDTGVDYFLSFTKIPAPGALALLGLAGLAGTRRRRR